jgi:hypothetical protein
VWRPACLAIVPSYISNSVASLPAPCDTRHEEAPASVKFGRGFGFQARCPDPHSFSHACLLTIAVADLSQAANREFLPNRSLQARSDTRSGCFRSELSPARRFRVPDANGRSQYPAKGSACLAGVALAPRSSKCADLSAGDFYSKRFLTCSLQHMTATIPVIGVLGLLQCRSCRSGRSTKTKTAELQRAMGESW